MGPLVRWEPPTTLSRLRQEMDRLLEDFFGETPEEARAPLEMLRIPSVDVVDTDDQVVVRAEMPGIDKENIQVQATPEALMLRAEIKEEKEKTEENIVRRERRQGAFQRIIPLPAEVKANDVTASYKDGILEVCLPKSEHARSKKPVKVQVE